MFELDSWMLEAIRFLLVLRLDTKNTLLIESDQDLKENISCLVQKPLVFHDLLLIKIYYLIMNCSTYLEYESPTLKVARILETKIKNKKNITYRLDSQIVLYFFFNLIEFLTSIRKKPFFLESICFYFYFLLLIDMQV